MKAVRPLGLPPVNTARYPSPPRREGKGVLLLSEHPSEFTSEPIKLSGYDATRVMPQRIVVVKPNGDILANDNRKHLGPVAADPAPKPVKVWKSCIVDGVKEYIQVDGVATKGIHYSAKELDVSKGASTVAFIEGKTLIPFASGKKVVRNSIGMDNAEKDAAHDMKCTGRIGHKFVPRRMTPRLASQMDNFLTAAMNGKIRMRKAD